MIGRYSVTPCPVCDVEPCGNFELVVNVSGVDVERTLWPSKDAAEGAGRTRVALIRSRLTPLSLDDLTRLLAALDALDAERTTP